MREPLGTRRGLRVLTVSTLTAALAISALVPSAAGATTAVATSSVSSTKVARWGAGWLDRQIIANGGHLVAFGAPDVSDTAYAVLALHAAGVGKSASDEAIAYLTTQLGALTSGGSDAPGTLAYFIMAAVSAGADPRHFGGSGAQRDLVARLLATARTSGSDTGLFGAQDPTFDGAFRQGLALAALKAAKVSATKARVVAGIAWLNHQQCANGLWEAYRSNTSTPCPPADPNTFTGPDTNSTALAVQGLAAYGAHPHRNKVLSALHSSQSSDAGFPFVAAAGQSSDPNSTALVIQAILAEGDNPGSSTWTVSGATPYIALAGFQLGCSDPVANRGAFFFPGSRDPNIFATVQAVPAAAGTTLPLAPSTPSDASPSPKCT